MSELRLFPRIATQLEAEASNHQGDQQMVKVRNLSPGGLMIDSDLAFRDMISAPPAQGMIASPIEISICFRLPEDPIPFRNRCRLVFVRRLSQLEFNFGFRFVDMSQEMAARLDRYVRSGMDAPPSQPGHAEGL